MASHDSRLRLADDSATIPRRTLIGAAFAVVVISAALWVYLRMFSGFSVWDDEGYLMFGVRYLVRGHRLYNEVYAQYGPFYYLVQWLYYTIIAKPVTHDLVRILAACMWLGSATLLAWCAHRMTRSWIVTGFAYFAMLRVLSLLANAPGHPEEICLMLAAAILVICCLIGDKLRLWQAGALGVLLAALTLTKINIGLYLGSALLLILLAANAHLLLRRYLFGLTGMASLVGVFLLMRPLWEFGWARHYCFLMAFSILAVLIVISAKSFETVIGLRAWGILAAAFAISAGLILLPFLLNGTTLYAFIWSTVLQYKNFSRSWYFALPASRMTASLSALSLGLAVLWTWSIGRDSLHKRISFYLQTLKGVAGLFVLAVASIGSNPQIMDARLFSIATPFLWLVLIPPRGEKMPDTAFARPSLCLLAVYFALYPFPVAGAQVSLPLAVMLVAAAIFIRDAWVNLTLASKPGWPTPNVRAAASTCLVLLLIMLYLRQLTLGFKGYRSLVSLDLPGARRVHVDKFNRDTYHWLVNRSDGQCDTLFSMPGIMSLYFWTETPPPTLYLTSNWMGLMSPGQQQAAVNGLSKYRRACIVYNPGLVLFWLRGQDLSQSPLARYIKNNFVPVAENHGYYFMLRKNR